MTLLDFLSGPALLISLLAFIGGMLGRTIWYVRGLHWQRDGVAYGASPRRTVQGALHSIGAWLRPRNARGERGHSLFFWSGAVFHSSFILLVLFQSEHVSLRTAHMDGFFAVSLPLFVSDILTACALGSLGLLIGRRLCSPMLRFLTTRADWCILVLCAFVVASGLVVRVYSSMPSSISANALMLHMASAELLLILAPYSFLVHMVFFFLSRGQLGADFAVKRGGAKRGAGFPW